MKRLLLLSTTTGYQAQEFRAAAERIGIPLALATDSCHALDDPWRDGAISVRFQKPRESAGKIREFAQHHPIHGIAAIGDAPTRTAALVSQELGIAFHPPEAVEACRNKFLARERYKQAGMQVPWYTKFKAASDAETAARAVPYPCVLKPLGLSASRGVIRANNQQEFAAAFVRIRALLQARDIKIMREESAAWIQVESYIPGVEIALEGLVTGGCLRRLAIFDKPDPLEGPFFEETIYVTPSRLPAPRQQAVMTCAQQAVTALGLSHGPVHAELRLNDSDPWMLDMAARPIGGLCAGALRFLAPGSEAALQRVSKGRGGTCPERSRGSRAGQVPSPCHSEGTLVPEESAVRSASAAATNHLLSLEELILRHALGEDVTDIARERAAAGVMMIPIPQAGFYEGVENLEAAQQVPGVERVEITAKLQQKLVPLPEGSSYLGFIFARGETPALVESALRESHRRLRFLISPEIPVL
jgi:hypothetical protein